MSRKPVPAHSGERSRVDVLFDKPQLLPRLFGQYDQNLVALENRLGVYITARGNRIGLEGTAEQVAMARDVLNDLYMRIQRGEDVDSGLVDAAIAMASEPTLDGIISAERAETPPIMIRTRKKTIVPRTPAQAHYMRELTTHEMIFALGPAGTGKTYIAVAQAVSQLISGSVQRLILSRPAVEAGERLGFLPGDMKEKVDPYLRPLYDALYDCLPAEQVEQNSRMVICGDPNQTDLPGGVTASGLADATARLEGIEGISLCRFTAGDVVRHAIVGRIVAAYEGE